jgi:DNA-binding NtrC family response regulator
VIRLTIPPLRDRPEDILPLANHFLGVFNQRFGRQVREISPQAEEALLGHDWPGNVRELRNSIERSVVLEDGPALQAGLLGLGSDTLDPSPGHLTPEAQPSLKDLPLGEAERSLLLHALDKAGWNQTKAARTLNITRDTLRYKMKKYQLRQSAAGS